MGMILSATRDDLPGRSSTGSAHTHGAWSIQLPPLSAGGPFTLVISGKKDIVIKDVLVGEVWIASGQSNMAFSLDGAEGAAAEIPKANYSQTVPKKIALSPQENTLPTRWQAASSRRWPTSSRHAWA